VTAVDPRACEWTGEAGVSVAAPRPSRSARRVGGDTERSRPSWKTARAVPEVARRGRVIAAVRRSVGDVRGSRASPAPSHPAATRLLSARPC